MDRPVLLFSPFIFKSRDGYSKPKKNLISLYLWPPFQPFYMSLCSLFTNSLAVKEDSVQNHVSHKLGLPTKRIWVKDGVLALVWGNFDITTDYGKYVILINTATENLPRHPQAHACRVVLDDPDHWFDGPITPERREYSNFWVQLSMMGHQINGLDKRIIKYKGGRGPLQSVNWVEARAPYTSSQT